MGEPHEIQGQRLDSWKEIAAYLDRDVRTVRRWEKSLGLPVRRVPGSRGHSVFAYSAEIEAWLQKSPPMNGASAGHVPGNGSGAPNAAAAIETAAAVAPEHRHRLPGRLRSRQWMIVVAGVAIGLLSWAAWPAHTHDELAIEVTPTAVIARGANGAERWRHRFPAGERAVPHALPTNAVRLDRPDPGVLVGIGNRTRGGADTLEGQLLWLTPDGQPQRTFAFDDRLAFGDRPFGAPWLLTDFDVDDRGGRRRVAVAAHHHHWWPSMVAVLDGQGRRERTFVNAGWIEWVEWQSPDRLLIAGFSNARDGGMVALLDANGPDGQSPPTDDESFRCSSCGTGAPIRYVVMPRSEVNSATVSPFNRGILTRAGDGVTIRTLEVPSAGAQAVDALYEFTPHLDLLSASYSDKYWDTHRALEAQGKLNHSRAECPEARGPRSVEVWEPRAGWKTLPNPVDR